MYMYKFVKITNISFMCKKQVSFHLSYAIILNAKIKEGPISNNIIIH